MHKNELTPRLSVKVMTAGGLDLKSGCCWLLTEHTDGITKTVAVVQSFFNYSHIDDSVSVDPGASNTIN